MMMRSTSTLALDNYAYLNMPKVFKLKLTQDAVK